MARVLTDNLVSDEDKAELREAYAHVDLINLRGRIDELQERLLRSLSPAQ